MSIEAAMEILGARGRVARVPFLLPVEEVARVIGDGARPRLCAFTAADGRQWCLRPDLTAPILIDMAGRTSGGASEPLSYHYRDTAFRMPQEAGAAIEFEQAGFEWFGGVSDADADADAIEVALRAVQAMSVTRFVLRLGDAGLWNRLIDVVEMDAVWRRRFRRAWPGTRGLREMVVAACARPPRSALARALASAPAAEAARAIEELSAIEGAALPGSRDSTEIAAALVEKSNVAPLPEASRDVLLSYLDIGGDARGSAEAIDKMTKGAGLDISESLQTYAVRLDKLCDRAPSSLSGWEFGAEFGRGFDYYDGVVFELTHDSLPPNQALARGGRYDGILARLGVEPMPALGVALRPDRVVAAARADA